MNVHYVLQSAYKNERTRCVRNTERFLNKLKFSGLENPQANSHTDADPTETGYGATNVPCKICLATGNELSEASSN